MAERKIFQSGREIFRRYIPDYIAENTSTRNRSKSTDELVEAIMCDFNAGNAHVAEGKPQEQTQS